MEDRRSFARIDHQHLVSYTRKDAEDTTDHEGMAKTLNLSVDGVLLLLPAAVDAGTRLSLELNLEGTIVEAAGVVARCLPDRDKEGMFDVGIALDHIPPQFIEIVQSYVAKVETAQLD